MPLILAKSDDEIQASFALMKQLRPHLDQETYVSRIRKQQDQGYHLILLNENGEAKAAAGYRISENLAWGKFLYVDDLITDEKSRSRGYAQQIFDWLEEEAARQQCAALHLDSGVQRHDAHRFYLNGKMKISCHHFEKTY